MTKQKMNASVKYYKLNAATYFYIYIYQSRHKTSGIEMVSKKIKRYN